MQINHELEAFVTTAIKAAQNSGALPAFELPTIQVERPRDPSKGDYASPAAMQMARLARMAPLKIVVTNPTTEKPCEICLLIKKLHPYG